MRLYVDGVGRELGTVGLRYTLGNGSILNSAPLTIGAEPDGSDGFDGNMNDARGFWNRPHSPAQILQLADDASTSSAVLGQFAFGGGWYSAIYFSNTGTSSVSFPVNFKDDNGNPLNVPSLGSSTTVTLTPGASTVLEALNQGTPTNQGYVTMNLPVGVTGYGVFRLSGSQFIDQEAVVPIVYAKAGTQTMVYDEINSTTSIAIVNPSKLATSVTITAEDLNGTVIATSASPLVLQPGAKKEDLLKQLTPGLSSVANNRGVVKFTASNGSIVVLGIRSRSFALTSDPGRQPKAAIWIHRRAFFLESRLLLTACLRSPGNVL